MQRPIEMYHATSAMRIVFHFVHPASAVGECICHGDGVTTRARQIRTIAMVSVPAAATGDVFRFRVTSVNL